MSLPLCFKKVVSVPPYPSPRSYPLQSFLCQYENRQNGGLPRLGVSLRSAFGIWDGAFGIWDSLFGIWDSVFGTYDSVFGVWNSVFGIWYPEIG